MICKIGAPLVILEFLSYVGTHKVAVVVIAIISTVSWGVECRAATKIWKGNRRLQAPKRKESDELEMDELDTQSETHQYPEKPSIHQSTLARTIAYIEASYHTHMDGLRYYFSTDVYIPSICVAVLHASVLSYGGTFTTYLLNAGLTYNSLTYAKAVGSVFEIGSTILFPYAVTWLSSSRTKSVIDPDDPQGPKIIEVREHLLEGSSDGEGEATEETRQTQNPYLESGMIRVGLWGICGLFICLVSQIFHILPAHEACQLIHPSDSRHFLSVQSRRGRPYTIRKPRRPCPTVPHVYAYPLNAHPLPLPLLLIPRPLDLRPQHHATHPSSDPCNPSLQFWGHRDGGRQCV